jgi:hypothetical protein
MLNSAFDVAQYHSVKTQLHSQNTKCCFKQEAPLKKGPRLDPMPSMDKEDQISLKKTINLKAIFQN